MGESCLRTGAIHRQVCEKARAKSARQSGKGNSCGVVEGEQLLCSPTNKSGDGGQAPEDAVARNVRTRVPLRGRGSAVGVAK
jgi:hypothetical protein